MERWRRIQGGWRRHADALLAVGIIGIILLLVVPLPGFLLDALLCFSIVLSVMTLLLTLYVENPLEFSAFPSLLLFLTLYRLGLNIASTRMILTRAEAGDIIATFGGFIIQGNFIVGLVLFALLTVINFVVVTKGAGRIAEVSARFTLEALPGKQMAIENELSAGLLTQQEARKIRERITAEADFYGAMDGASKFVRGDAIAGIIIILINVVGGLIVGTCVKQLPLDTCIETMIRLTVGDGLVSQLPALLISIGAGIIVTRASSGSVGKTLPRQVFGNGKVLILAGGVIFSLCLIPGMPLLIMIPIGVILVGYGIYLSQGNRRKGEHAQIPQVAKLEDTPIVYPLEVQLGVQVVAYGEALLQKTVEIRRHIASRWGVHIPPFHICDQLQLSPKEYGIKLRGISVFTGRAQDLDTLVKKITEVIELHLHELINRQEVVRLIEKVKQEDAAVVEELIPERIKMGQILRVLQNLLREKVPIRDFTTILELIADYLPLKGEIDVDYLTENVRKGLSRGISDHFFGEKKVAYAITIDPKVEHTLHAALQQGGALVLRPITAQKIRSSLQDLFEKAITKGIKPVVLTQPTARRSVRHLIEKELPLLPILSFEEVGIEVEVKSLGTVSTEVLIG